MKEDEDEEERPEEGVMRIGRVTVKNGEHRALRRRGRGLKGEKKGKGEEESFGG